MTVSGTRIAITLLLEDAPLAALVSARIYPVAAPQETALPFITVAAMHEEQDMILAGARQGFTTRVGVSCHAATAGDADAMGEAVKAALDDVMHRSVSTDESPPEVLGTATVFKTGSDHTDYTDDRSVFRRLIDWNVRWIPA